MASDKNHRPCLPLKPQEKIQNFLLYNILMKDINFNDKKTLSRLMRCERLVQ